MDPKLRGNSILKKPVLEESSPTQTATFTRNHRRISFSGKKSVKEFLPGDDKATIWGTSYEESAEGLQMQQSASETHKQEKTHAQTNIKIESSNKDKDTLSNKENIKAQISLDNVKENNTTDKKSVQKDEIFKIYVDNDEKVDNKLNITVNANEISIPPNRSPFHSSVTLYDNEFFCKRRKLDLTLQDINIEKNVKFDCTNHPSQREVTSYEEDGSASVIDFYRKSNSPLIFNSTEIADILDVANDNINFNVQKIHWSNNVPMYHQLQERKPTIKSECNLESGNTKAHRTTKILSAAYSDENDMDLIALKQRNLKPKGRQTINFQSDKNTDENDMDLSIDQNNILSHKQQTMKAKGRQTINFQSAACDQENNLELTSNQNMDSTKDHQLMGSQQNPRNRETINFQSAACDLENDLELISNQNMNSPKDHQNLSSQQNRKNRETINIQIGKNTNENFMNMSIDQNNTLSHKQQNMKAKGRQTINFQSAACDVENDLELTSIQKMDSTKYHQILDSQQNPKNRKTNFQSDKNTVENDMDLSIDQNNTLSHKEQNLKAKGRQTINFQSAACDVENDLELTSKQNKDSTKDRQILGWQQNPKNRETINFQSGKYTNENDMDLSNYPNNTLSHKQQNMKAKGRQTINFQSAACDVENDLELTSNQNKDSTKDRQILGWQQNPKNRESINFQSGKNNDENDMDLSDYPNNTLSHKQQNVKTKGRQTINFQSAACDVKNDLELTSNQNINSPKDHQNLSPQQNPKNRKTNFQIGKNTNENFMNVSIDQNNTLPHKQQNLKAKGRQTINFQSAACDVENDLELTSKQNKDSTKDRQILGWQQNPKNRETINFQSGKYTNENDMDLSNYPNNTLSHKQQNMKAKGRQTINFQSAACDVENDLELTSIQKMDSTKYHKILDSQHNPQNRKTINFQSDKNTDENDMDLSIDQNNTLSHKEQNMKAKGRQTINFQSAACDVENDLELTSKQNKDSTKDRQILGWQQNPKNRETINFQSGKYTNENDMDLSNYPNNTLSHKQQNMKAKGRQTINFQSAACDVENDLELTSNQNKDSTKDRQILGWQQNPKNRESINFQSGKNNDENDMDLSDYPNNTLSHKQQNVKTKGRQTINFQSAACDVKNDLELTSNQNINSPKDHQNLSPQQNPKNRKTNFQIGKNTNENFMNVSIDQNNTLPHKQQNLKAKGRQTINFQSAACDVENDLELTSIQKMDSRKYHQIMGSQQKPKNRETINFQSGKYTNENDMDLSNYPNNTLSHKQQNMKAKGRQTINFQSAACDVENDLELTSNQNKDSTKDRQILGWQQNPKNRESINFQSGKNNDENDMDLSDYPNNTLSHKQQNVKTKGRQTINFQSAACDVKNDLELTSNQNINSPKDHQNLSPQQNPKNRKTNFQIGKNTNENFMNVSIDQNNTLSHKEQNLKAKGRQTINFQSTACDVENYLEFTSNQNMDSTKDHKILDPQQNKKNRETINFQSGKYTNENYMDLSIDQNNTMTHEQQNLKGKGRQTITFQSCACDVENDLELTSIQKMDSTKYHQILDSQQNSKNRETINFQSDKNTVENDMDLSIDQNNTLSHKEQNLKAKGRQTINFQSAACDVENDLELTSNQKMDSTKDHQILDPQQNPKNRETINFQSDKYTNENDMDLSIDQNYTLSHKQQNMKGKGRQTINFQIKNQNMDSTKNHQNLSSQQNRKNRETINFQIGKNTNENFMNMSIDQNNTLPHKQQNLEAKGRQTINFQSAACDVENDLELTSNENMDLTKDHQLMGSQQNPKNLETINFQTGKNTDEIDMDLSNYPNNTLSHKEQNMKGKGRQTINFQSAACDVENDLELTSNQKLDSTRDHQILDPQQNPKNRETINFQSDKYTNENDMDLSIDQNYTLSHKQQNMKVKGRQTINFQIKNQNMDSTKNHQVLSSQQNPKNRETINFQSGKNSDENFMDLSIDQNNTLPHKEQNMKGKGHQTINFQSAACDVENDLELTSNQKMDSTKDHQILDPQQNRKNRETINFQSGKNTDENDMNLSNYPNNTLSHKQENLKTKGRQTINFQNAACDLENDLELISNQNMNSPKDHQNLSSQQNRKNRETINFQSGKNTDENDMDLSNYPNNTLSHKQQNLISKGRQTINFQSAACDLENDLELTTNQNMDSTKDHQLMGSQQNPRNRETINFQSAACDLENDLELISNQNMNSPKDHQNLSSQQNRKNRETINFQSGKNTDENDMDLSNYPNNTLSHKHQNLKAKGRQTINFKNVGCYNDMEISILQSNTSLEQHDLEIKSRKGRPTIKEATKDNYLKPSLNTNNQLIVTSNEQSINESTLCMSEKFGEIILSKSPNQQSCNNESAVNDDKNYYLNITSCCSYKKSPRKQVFRNYSTLPNNRIHVDNNADFINTSSNDESECTCSNTFLKEQTKFLYTNVEEIDKTHLSLVSSFIDDDTNFINVSQIASSLHKNSVQNSQMNYDKNNENMQINSMNKRPICAVCKRNANDTTLKNFVLEEIPEKYENIDWSGFDKFTTFPTISEVVTAFKKRQSNRESLSFHCEDSVIFPSTPKISFLLENFGAEYMKNYEEKICYTPIFPLAVSFEKLILNKYKDTNSPWHMNRNFVSHNVVIFSHVKNKTFNLVFKWHNQKNNTDIVHFEKVFIRINQLHKKLSTIERIQQNEIMRRLQIDLINIYPTSHEFNKCLDEVDRVCSLVEESIKNLLYSIVENKCSLEYDNCIFIKKICRTKELGQLTKYQEFHIKLGHIDQLSYRDIIFPSKTLLKSSIQELPQGIDFLNVFLVDPVKYILKDRL